MFTKAIESVGRLFGLSGPADEDERRLWGRVRCDLTTECRPAGRDAGPPCEVRVHNVSAGGIGLYADQPFVPGALLSVTLPGGPEGAEPTQVLACVVRCDAAGMRWEMGCTFAGELADADLARFGARRLKPAADDQRQWVRFGCHARATYQVVRMPAPTEPADAAVRDISAGGVQLEVSEPVAVGDLLSLDLSRDGEFVLTTLASVVRTEPGPDGRRIAGCNFIRELPEETLGRLA